MTIYVDKDKDVYSRLNILNMTVKMFINVCMLVDPVRKYYVMAPMLTST